MKCKCGDEITFSNYYTKNQCVKCRKRYLQAWNRHNTAALNTYKKEWARTRRWLNGTDRSDDLGPDMNIQLKTVGDIISVYRNGEKIA